ncbi:MAG: response regulator [Planctomycetia bacterium]
MNEPARLPSNDDTDKEPMPAADVVERQVHVLVVDDESPIRRIIAMHLTRAGFLVELAADGEEALAKIVSRPPDLILSDLQMPRSSGLQLCAVLATDEATRKIPVVLLTARSYELEEADLHLCPNILQVLCKPFSPSDLLNTVRETLILRNQE